MILEDLLCEHYQVHAAAGGREALDHLARRDGIDLILLDVVMPEVDGFEVCRRVKADPRLRDIPVLFLTSLESAADEATGLSLGAEDFIHKPFSPPAVLARVQNHLKISQMTRLLKNRNEDLERLVDERTRQILEQSEELVLKKQEVIAAQGATITAFCSLAEARDNETGNHIRRTQNYVKALAEQLRNHPRFRDQLNDEIIQLLFKSAPLHDIGKVAIPDAILHKPGKLDPEEWAEMQRHCEHGRDAIAQAEVELAKNAVNSCATPGKLLIAITKNGMAVAIPRVCRERPYPYPPASWRWRMCMTPSSPSVCTSPPIPMNRPSP